MFWAFFRLILIAVTTALVFFGIGFALRTVGEQQVYTVTHHPLLDHGPLYVAWGGLTSDTAVPFSLPAYQAAAEKKLLLGLDLRVSRDGRWFIYPDKWLDSNTFLTHETSGELAQKHLPNSNAKILTFNELIEKLPQANYYVVVDNPATPYLGQLFEAIENAHIEEHFILSSPFTDTTKYLRERNAHWLTGSTTAEIAKAQLLSSLYLEPLITTMGEMVQLDKVDARLMGELRKRQLGVLLKSEDAAEIKDLLKQNLISGAVTTRPGFFAH